MLSWETPEDSSADSVSLTAPDAQDGLMMHSSSSSYKILDFIGEGGFGTIVSSMNLRTKQIVAVKILKESEFAPDAEHEVTMLKVISDLDVDLVNMVRFHEAFQHLDHTCLVFEQLDMSVFDLLKQREWEHRPLDEIRPVAKQLLVALDALKGLGVLHADIKPDNVMFVNRKTEPFRVKLIDFGCAMMASEVQLGMDIQPCGYMAPEICLGLPITEAIDVWGVGCVLAFMYLAQNLFSVKCEYRMMKNMVTLLGLPQDHLLRAGRYSNQFFIEEEGEDGPSWRLMTAEEFTAVSNVKTEEEESFIKQANSLNDLIHIHPKLGAAEMKDRKAFVSLLEGLLHLDGDERISPHQALELPFISMSHLRWDVHSRDYLTDSEEAMGFCPNDDSFRWSSSDSGSSGSMDQDSLDSVEALDSTSDTDELSWCSDSVIESTDTACSPTFIETSEVLYKGSDLKTNSRATWVWCPIMDDDTSEEVSGSCNEAADVSAAAAASHVTAAAAASHVTAAAEASDVTAAAEASDVTATAAGSDVTAAASDFTAAVSDFTAAAAASDVTAAASDFTAAAAASHVTAAAEASDVTATAAGSDVTAAAAASHVTAAATASHVTAAASDFTAAVSDFTAAAAASDVTAAAAASHVTAAAAASDVSAAATASSRGKKKLLRRIRKFFSSLLCCCCPEVED